MFDSGIKKNARIYKTALLMEHKEIKDEKPRNRIFIIRQILNIIFIIGAIAGAIFYWTEPEPTLGILIIMTAMFFKMAECVLRYKR